MQSESKRTSKFFAHADESSEEEENVEEVEEETEERKQPAAKPSNRFARAAGFLSDSDDETRQRRVVKSQKDKKEEELNALVRALKNHMKINDWKEIVNDFEKLNKQVAKEADPSELYLRTLIQLEDFVKKTNDNADAKRKLSLVNSKSFNAMKQKLKKNNKLLAEKLEQQRKAMGAPVVARHEVEVEDEDEDEEEAEPEHKTESEVVQKHTDDEDEGEGEGKETGATKADEADAESEDSIEWDADADDEEEEEEEVRPRERKPMGRAFWTKSAAVPTPSTADDRKIAREAHREKHREDQPQQPPQQQSTPSQQQQQQPPSQEQTATGTTVAENAQEVKWTAELVDKRLSELRRRRGRKEVDRLAQVDDVERLLERSFSALQTLALLIELCKAQFDVVADEHRKTPAVDMWRRCYRTLVRVLQLLRQHPQLRLEDSEDQDDAEALVNAPSTSPTAAPSSTPAASASAAAASSSSSASASSNNAANVPSTSTGSSEVVSGNLLGLYERLDDEWTKSLQLMEPHTAAYSTQLAEESPLVELGEQLRLTYEEQPKRAAQMGARLLEHYYYRTYPAVKRNLPVALQNADGSATTATSSPAASLNASGPVSGRDPFHLSASEAFALQERLAHLVYAHGDERMRTRAVLAQIYHYSLHDRFFEARDMLLMSHLSDAVQHMEVPTQILFNRAMTQLGLCAFRRGLFAEAHSALAELYASGRGVREFLAQGTSQRFYQQPEKTLEQERAEKRRLVPQHMWIHLETVEAAHLISAMLLEVPNMAANAFDPRKKVISRQFRRLLEQHERQPFSGPPENTRECVVAAARALLDGDVERCAQLLVQMSVWQQVSNADTVRSMLRQRVQEEGLRTWLFANSRHYDSISLELLANLFQLSTPAVQAIVSKMLIAEELHASWDQAADVVVLHHVEPSRLQYLALQLADRVAVFVDSNERALDLRTGGQYYHDKQPRGDARADGKGPREWSGGYAEKRRGAAGGSDRSERGDRRERFDRGERRDRGLDRGDRDVGGQRRGMQSSGGMRGRGKR